MSSLSQFFGGGSSPVGSASTLLPASSTSVVDTGSQVFVKTGATVFGAPSSTVSKVQSGTMPGFATLGGGMSSGVCTNSSSGGTSIAYGNNVWIRTSEASLFRSADGISWKPIVLSSDTASGFYKPASRIIYFNGYFILGAISTTSSLGHRIFYSTDGLTWQYHIITSNVQSSPVVSLSIANGIAWCAISTSAGQISTLIRSSDGFTWTTVPSFSTSATQLNDVVYGASRYVISAINTSTGYSSADGITWSTFSALSTNSTKFLNSTQFISVGQSGALYTSTNGTTWTSRTSNASSNDLYDVEYGAGLYVAVGNTGTIVTSPDGITWTARTSGTSNNLQRIIFANNLFVVSTSGNIVLTSSDGITWTSRTIPFSTGVSFLRTATNNNLMYDGTNYWFVRSTNGRSIANSSNGTTWNRVLDTEDLSTGQALPAMYLVNGKLFQLPLAGGIQTADASTNEWKLTLNVTNQFTCVTYGNGVYVAVGINGVTYSSSDGNTWTLRSNGSTSFRAIEYAAGLFVAVGDSVCRTSPDGVTWTARTGMTINATTLGYASGIFLAHDGTTGIRTSADGINWISATLPASYSRMKVVGDLFFFLENGASTSLFLVSNGLYHIQYGNGNASVITTDAIELNGNYYVIDSSSTIYWAASKSAAMGSSGGFTTSASVSTGSSPGSNPSVYGSSLVSNYYMGKNTNEIFQMANIAGRVQADGGLFVNFSNPMYSEMNSNLSTTRLKIIVGSSYVYVVSNSSGNGYCYFYFERNALTSAYPALGNETIYPSTNTASMVLFRRVA